MGLCRNTGSRAAAVLLGSVCFVTTAPTEQVNASAAKWRDPAQQPFADSSIWNTPLGRGAVFAADDAAETRMLHSDDVGGRGGSYPWIARDPMGLMRARADDPLVRWRFDGRSASAPWPAGGPIANGSILLRTPAALRFLGGTDAEAVLIEPGGEVAYEAWLGRWDDAHREIHVRYLVRVDLRGSGIGRGEARSDGVRGFGGSVLGGLIRCNELVAGEIPHAVAMLLSTTQLRKGATMASQKTWPAMVSDGGGRNDYAGLVPMGALLAMRPDIDITALGLSREGTALARAYQRFGGYVVDAATKTMTLAVVQDGCDPSMVKRLEQDRRIIRDRLARILNTDPAHPGGPGVRVALPPPPLRPR